MENEKIYKFVIESGVEEEAVADISELLENDGQYGDLYDQYILVKTYGDLYVGMNDYAVVKLLKFLDSGDTVFSLKSALSIIEGVYERQA